MRHDARATGAVEEISGNHPLRKMARAAHDVHAVRWVQNAFACRAKAMSRVPFDRRTG
jgi:hypothetical protein